MVKPRQLGHVVLPKEKWPRDGDLFGSTPFPLGSLEEEPEPAVSAT